MNFGYTEIKPNDIFRYIYKLIEKNIAGNTYFKGTHFFYGVGKRKSPTIKVKQSDGELF